MRKQKRKYSPPRHPWRLDRILSEKDLIREYGLKNHMEIWRAIGKLRNWKVQAKATVGLMGEQRDNAQARLISKLMAIGVLKQGANVDDILGLGIRDVLERRLQTIIYRKGLAHTQKQARQIIVHNKVLVNGKKVNSPSFKVKLTDEVALVPGFILPASKPIEMVKTTTAVKEGGAE